MKNPDFFANQIADTGLDKGINLDILEEWVRVMKKINIYIWCNKGQIIDYVDYFVKQKGCNWDIIIWAKSNTPPFCSTHYLVDKEYCLYFWEQGVKLNIPFERGRTFYTSTTNKDDKKDFAHPTIKPLEMTKTFILNSSQEGNCVLDTFVGSGTTALAAKETNRDYIAFEINDKYYQIAVDRLKGITANGQMTIFANFEDNE